MALYSAPCFVFRQLYRLHSIPLPTRYMEHNLTHQVKLFHGSSARKNVQSRIMGFFKASPNRSLMLKQRDHVPKDFTLIYKAPMERYMKYGYPVALFCVIGAPGVMMYHYYVNGEMLYRREVNEIVFLDPEKEIWFFMFALSLCTWAIFAVIFRYPFRIYKRNDYPEYIAMFLSAIPLQMRQFRYSSAVNKKFKNPLYFFVPDSQFTLDGTKKAIIIPHYFRTPADLCEMSGID